MCVCVYVVCVCYIYCIKNSFNSFQSESIDIKTEARAVVANVRDFVLRTKEGQSYILHKVPYKLKIIN